MEFITESQPIRKNISDKKLISIIEHKDEGLTEEEIITLLDWTVENTRKNIEKYTKKSIENDDLTGLCGFARTSSLLPFENIFKETYNSTTDFPLIISELRHAFGTITFPLKTSKGIEEKEYIIDVTARQYFIKEMCENPNYRDNGTYEMYPGYFLCIHKAWHTKESIKLAHELLKNGYIELTDDNLKTYIESFMLSSIYATNQNYLHMFKEFTIETYKELLKKPKPFELEFDEDDLLKYGCITRLPYIPQKNKSK